MAKDFNRLKPWIEKQTQLAGLPIYKLANRAGISRASIYAWMNDTTRPDSETLLRVVQVLADHTDQDSAKLHAEALAQYTNRPEGRAPGTKLGPYRLRTKS